MSLVSQAILFPPTLASPIDKLQPYGESSFTVRTNLNVGTCDDMNQVENVLKFLANGYMPLALKSIIIQDSSKLPKIIKELDTRIGNGSIIPIAQGFLKSVYLLPQDLCNGKGGNFIYKISRQKRRGNPDVVAEQYIDDPDLNVSGCSAYWEDKKFYLDNTRISIPRLMYFCSQEVIEAFANIYTSDLFANGYTPHLLYTSDQYITYQPFNGKREYIGHCIQEKISSDIHNKNFRETVVKINGKLSSSECYNTPRWDFVLALQMQIAFTLEVLSMTLKFRSNDLWLKNLYYKYNESPNDKDMMGNVDLNKQQYTTYKIDDNVSFTVKNTGFRLIISDFDRCRFETPSIVFNNYFMQKRRPDRNESALAIFDFLYQLPQWLWTAWRNWEDMENDHFNRDIVDKCAIFTDCQDQNRKITIGIIIAMLANINSPNIPIHNFDHFFGKNNMNNYYDCSNKNLGRFPVSSTQVLDEIFSKFYSGYSGEFISVDRYLNELKCNAFVVKNNVFSVNHMKNHMIWLKTLLTYLESTVSVQNPIFTSIPGNITFSLEKITGGKYDIENIKTLHKYYDLVLYPSLESSKKPYDITTRNYIIKPFQNFSDITIIPTMISYNSNYIGNGVSVYEFFGKFSGFGLLLTTGKFYDGWKPPGFFEVDPVEAVNSNQFMTLVKIPKTSQNTLKASLYHYDAPQSNAERKNNPKKSLQQIFGKIKYENMGFVMSGSYFNYKNWKRTDDGKYDIILPSPGNNPPIPNCVYEPSTTGCDAPTCDRNVGYYKTEKMTEIVQDEEISDIYKYVYGTLNIYLNKQGGAISKINITKNTYEGDRLSFSDGTPDILLSGGPILLDDTAGFDFEQYILENSGNIKMFSNPLYSSEQYGPCILSAPNAIGGFPVHGMSPNPRLMAGINNNGDLLLLSVEGRNARGFGVDLLQLTRLAKVFGCVKAINLDGGKTADILYKPINVNPSVLVNTNPVHKMVDVVANTSKLYPGLYPSTALVFKSI